MDHLLAGIEFRGLDRNHNTFVPLAGLIEPRRRLEVADV